MNSKSFQIFIALSVPIIVIILVLLLKNIEKGSDDTSKENIPDISQGSNNYSGNTYTPSIEIDSLLATVESEKQNGRVILAKNLEDSSPLAIFLPDSLKKTVHPMDKFKAKLKVMDNGGFEVLELNEL